MAIKIRIMILITFSLFSVSLNAQEEEVFYTPKLPQVELNEAKTNLARALKSASFLNHEKNFWYKPENASVFDDRFVVSFKQPQYPIAFYFYNLSKVKIEVIRIHKTDNSWGFELRLGKLTTSVSKDKTYGWELADYLFYFQQQHIKNPFNTQLELFSAIAAQYRALKIKPSVSEEQRKYIVQANFLNQQKMYVKAIETYNKALELDQTAYPAAYSNLALLSAQIGDFDAAIYYMKKYLLLEPEATDARSGQDKIYEWELLIVE